MNTKQYANNKLKEFRKAQGLRQTDVCALLNIRCEGRVGHWEKGISAPNIENLYKLAMIYKVMPHQLYPNLFDESAVLQASEGKLQTSLTSE